MLIQLEPHQLDAVLPLYHAALGQPGCTWSEEYPSPECLAEDIRTGCLWGWVENGRIIAAAAVEQADEADVVCLARVVTARDCQGRGVARQMLAVLLEKLRQKYSGVRLLVSPDNPAALRLYARLGFRSAGECDCYDHHWLIEERLLS